MSTSSFHTLLSANILPTLHFPTNNIYLLANSSLIHHPCLLVPEEFSSYVRWHCNMADHQESSEVQSNQELQGPATSNGQEINRSTSDDHDISLTMERAREAYRTYSRLEPKPERREIWAWYAYELCSYFVHTALIPIVFSLIIGQIVDLPSEPPQGWSKSDKGLTCKISEMQL